MMSCVCRLEFTLWGYIGIYIYNSGPSSVTLTTRTRMRFHHERKRSPRSFAQGIPTPKGHLSLSTLYTHLCASNCGVICICTHSFLFFSPLSFYWWSFGPPYRHSKYIYIGCFGPSTHRLRVENSFSLRYANNITLPHLFYILLSSLYIYIHSATSFTQ